jgi:phosphoribosyl 1,2-cyclic phosphodiesterase
MMRFASLGSGSRGNATLVEADGTCVMVDCGFSVVEVKRRMARLGSAPERLSAILVTHEHSDHFNGVAALSRRYGLPVWMTAGTYAQHRNGTLPDPHHFSGDRPFVIGGLSVQPFSVPHDAREPCQFVFGDGARRLGVLTDTGCITPHIRQMLDACDALFLEANHDSAMLADGPYPQNLKARIAGRLGHLSNAQAAALLAAIDTSRLQHLALAHLSDKNNTPRHALATVSEALGCTPDWLSVAAQEEGLDWRQIR